MAETSRCAVGVFGFVVESCVRRCRCDVTRCHVCFVGRFVVELCEPVKLLQVSLANLELFSSLPETFTLSVSDRCVNMCACLHCMCYKCMVAVVLTL